MKGELYWRAHPKLSEAANSLIAYVFDLSNWLQRQISFPYSHRCRNTANLRLRPHVSQIMTVMSLFFFFKKKKNNSYIIPNWCYFSPPQALKYHRTSLCLCEWPYPSSLMTVQYKAAMVGTGFPTASLSIADRGEEATKRWRMSLLIHICVALLTAVVFHVENICHGYSPATMIAFLCVRDRR